MLSHSELELRKQERNDFAIEKAIQTSAYSTGQVVGGIITIDNSSSAKGPIKESPLSTILQSLAVMDEDAQGQTIDLYFFSTLPAAAYVDGAAFAPSVADMKECVGVINVPTADYVASGAAVKIAAGKNQANLGRVLKPALGSALYMIPVIRGAATYASGKIYFRLQFSNGL